MGLNANLFAQQDPKAEKLIKSAKTKFNACEDITATFSYTLENKATKTAPVTKKGTILIQKEKYKITLPDQEMTCDGKTVWAHLFKEKEVNVSNYNPKESMSINKVFKLHEEGMKSKFDGPETVGGVAAQKLTLFPNRSDLEFFKIEVWVDGTEMLRKVKIHNRNGSNVTYELSNITFNSKIPITKFTFDEKKNPGVEVIDLRD